nr:60S ribosomal protein L34 [Cryptomonas sp.]
MNNSRVQHRHHCPYSTRKNSFRIIRTPGRRLTVLYRKKINGFIKCMDTKEKINGIQRKFSYKFKSLSKRKKKISRTYGGCLSGSSLRERIIRAFLIEEQNIVKKVLRIRKKKDNLAK